MINHQRSSRGSLCRYLLALPLFGLLVVGSQSCRQSTAPEIANAQSMPPATAEALPRTTNAHEVPSKDPVFEVAEVMPEFPGGTPALFEFISRPSPIPPRGYRQPDRRTGCPAIRRRQRGESEQYSSQAQHRPGSRPGCHRRDACPSRLETGHAERPTGKCALHSTVNFKLS